MRERIFSGTISGKVKQVAVKRGYRRFDVGALEARLVRAGCGDPMGVMKGGENRETLAKSKEGIAASPVRGLKP
jgi:hypothetical protein